MNIDCRGRARRRSESDSRVSDARTRTTGARAAQACSGEGHQKPGRAPVPYMPEFLDCKNGKVWPNDRPGLGVSVDEKHSRSSRR